MILHLTNGQVTISRDIDFGLTLCDSGQAFRWKRTDGEITGVVSSRLCRIRQDNYGTIIDISKSDYDSFWRNYFAVDDDYSALDLIHDPFLKECMNGRGLRIVRQDFFETLITFIFSAGNNIPSIRRSIEKFCACFGDYIEPDYFSFPRPEQLIGITAGEIFRKTGTRFPRTGESILHAAKLTLAGHFNGIENLPLSEQLYRIKQCYGIGDKIANCVALFGLHNLKAFPIDIWMKRVLAEIYGDTDTDRFGDLAGVAQQFMFCYAREHKERFSRHKKIR